MKLARLYVLAALPLAMAACGGDDDAAVSEIPAADTAAPMEAAPMEAAPMSAMINLDAKNDSGVTGQATVTAAGAQTEVMVQLSGLSEGTHVGHIHPGTCEAPGAPVAPLQDITAGADGSGTATSTIAIDAMTAMNGQHVVQYHGTATDPGLPVSCGAIPMHQM